MSTKKIDALHPVVKAKALKHKKKCETEGINLLIYSSYRSPKEQADLYAKGRTAPGKIVTSASPWKSWHNLKLAYDCVEIKDGRALWEGPNWALIGKLGKECGLAWGGDWKPTRSLPKGDRPHFDYKPGLTLALAKQRFESGEEMFPQKVKVETKVTHVKLRLIVNENPTQSFFMVILNLLKSLLKIN